MANNSSTKIMVRSCSFTVMVGIALALVPKSVFNTTVPDSIVEYLQSRSSFIASAYQKTENIYPDYGNKFIFGYVFLAFVFFLVSLFMTWAVARVNPRLDCTTDQLAPKRTALFAGFALILAVVFIQLIFPGPFLRPGGKINASPLTYYGFFWAFAQWFIAIAVVIWRRGSWMLAL